MAKRRIVPVVLLTGFLGAGKTTLLRQWLRAPAFADSVVIINEFGEIGIDDRLVRSSSEMVRLENGCACCTAGDDLAAALDRLFWQQLHREIPPVSRVIVETTGIAEPAPIIAAIGTRELLRERYRMAGVITVVDAARGAAQIEAYEECRAQLEACDLAVLTKTDLAAPADEAAVRSAVGRLAPNAQVLTGTRGALPAAQVLAALAAAPGPGSAIRHHDHDHGHAERFAARSVPLAGPLSRPRLIAAIEQVHGCFGERLLRLKGLAMLTGEGLCGVQLGNDGTVELLPLDEPAEPERLALVVIAGAGDAADIAAYLATRLAEAADEEMPETRK